jgi:glycosyltransferase involved in cell wall biosynthesis
MSTLVQRYARELSRRRRQSAALLREEGARGALSRVLAASARRLARPSLVQGIEDAEILQADLSAPRAHGCTPVPSSRPLTINVVTSPPGEGSGGHTTTFRIVRYLQAQGHTCRVYLYDFYRSDIEHFRSLIHRSYAGPGTEVVDVRGGMRDADAVFATSWETAYIAYNATAMGKRFYLVQDLESLFYAPSGASALAENTYRMGFHGITAGRWLATELRQRYGMEADWFDFGCDVDEYDRRGTERDGVVFYARPSAPRRAFELGVLSLELLAARHPEVRIHLFGDRVDGLRFPHVDHGHVPPAALNEIYNQCYAGLSLSMTNVSLVPWEMLAAGCIPVVNDAEHNRIVLDNPLVRYAEATPHALARAMGELITAEDFDDQSRRAAMSVASASWNEAGRQVELALRRALSSP